MSKFVTALASLDGPGDDCECMNCGHTWLSRVASPLLCPVCRYRVGRTPNKSARSALVCRYCGWEWESRVAKPKQCPNCSNPVNGTPKQRYDHKCPVCGRTWRSHVRRPKFCSRCKQFIAER